MSSIRERLTVNTVNSTIITPHLGITLRTLLGAALESWPERKPGEHRQFLVEYKNATIATLSVKEHNLEMEPDD